MKLSVSHIKLSTGWSYVAILNAQDAKKLGVHAFDRIKIQHKSKSYNAILDVSGSEFPVKPGEIGIFDELYHSIGHIKGSRVSVTPASKPKSIGYIRKKMDGFQLNRDELFGIIKDITERKLSDIEMTSFVAASYINQFTWDETVWLTEAMIRTGRRLNLNRKKVVDKHCIGGIPGNRTTMIIVPIIAANGLLIPKTSSRSITSPAGTADTMEVLANVELGFSRMKEIVEKVGGCIAWGGNVDLAPSDDQIIRIEHPLSIDAEGQLLASVIAKKASVNAKYLLVDIPFGSGAKCKSHNSAKRLGERFLKLGRRFGIETHIAITDGSQPIGSGAGPAIEAIDVMRVLSNAPEAPYDLKAKSIFLAGKMLEMVKKAKPGQGFEMALKTIESGKALAKMNEIIDAQGRKIRDYREIKLGKFRLNHLSKKKGVIRKIDNHEISQLAKTAGAPLDKAAGIRIHKHLGDSVSKGECLFTIYAESYYKLKHVQGLLKTLKPFKY